MLLLAAGDTCSMDVLVAEAKVIKYPVDDVKGGSGSKMKMWQVSTAGRQLQQQQGSVPAVCVTHCSECHQLSTSHLLLQCMQGMEESLAKYYVASIVLALEYLHDQNLVSTLLFNEGWLQHT